MALRREGAILDPVPDWEFQRALHVADQPTLSKVAVEMVAQTGRPRKVPYRTLFVLMAVAAMRGKGQLLLSTAAEVTRVLTPEQREVLGLDGEVAYKLVHAAVADLAVAFSPTANPRTGEIMPPRLSITLDEFVTGVVSEVLPRRLRRLHGTTAIDSTDYESHYLRQSTSTDGNADPMDGKLPLSEVEIADHKENTEGFPKMGADGRLIHTYDDEAREGYRSGKNGKTKETFLGYDIHIAVPVPDEGERGFASLITGATIRPAGDGKAEAGIALLDCLSKARMKPATVLSDRGYTYLRAENWAGQLSDRGIGQYLDLHTRQRGVHPGPLPGTIWVDGGLFVDSLPRELQQLPGFHLGSTATARDALIRRYDAREPYAFRPMGKPDSAGRKQRFRGPARAGTVRCPNHPASMRLDPSTRPTTACVKGRECSCAATPTMGPDDMLRERQRARFGTTAWFAAYGRRSAVESVNASLKTHHGVLRRGSVQVRGLVKTTILLVFILAATNIAIMLSAYGHDVGLHHPPDVEVGPLPTASKALHRKRKFSRRKRRSADRGKSPGARPRSVPTVPLANI